MAFLPQGFYTAVDRETLKCWRMTAANLAELAAGAQSASRSQNRRSLALSQQASAQLSEQATELIPTSNEPVVNTLWKVRFRITFTEKAPAAQECSCDMTGSAGYAKSMSGSQTKLCVHGQLAHLNLVIQ